MAEEKVYEIAVFGDSAAGKSELIRKLNCHADLETDAVSYHLQDGRVIKLRFYEISSEDPDSCLIGKHAVIFLHNLSNRKSINSLNSLYKKAFVVLGDAAYVFCGNKLDEYEYDVSYTKSKSLTMKGKKIKYYYISAKKEFNLLRPIECIIRQLIGDLDVYMRM